MDFNQLKELSTDEQIKWLNDRLSEGYAVSEIRNILGIGERALQKHIKSIAYKYDQKQRQYIYQQDKSNTVAIQERKSVAIAQQKDSSNVLALQMEASDYNKFIHILNNFEQLEKQVKELIKQRDREESIIEITPPKLEIKPMQEGKIISKTYKINSVVVDDFTKFCKDHSSYKVQDIISVALKEFIDKYK